MAKKNDLPRESHSADAGNPQQFRLMDLFALTTLVALVSAMVAPLLHGLESDYRNLLLRIISFQLLIATGAIVYYAKRRQRALDKSGAKIGAAFCGQFHWRYWPIVRTVFTIFFVISIQTLFAVVMAKNLLEYGELNGPISMLIDDWPFSHRVLHYLHYLAFLDYFFYAQYSFFLGYAFSLYRWRVYPNFIEFFEHGIVRKGTFFMPWERIEVRPSSLFADKIVIVVRTCKHPLVGQESSDSTGPKVMGSLTMAQVSDELREKVFAAAEANRVPKDNDTTPKRIH